MKSIRRILKQIGFKNEQLTRVPLIKLQNWNGFCELKNVDTGQITGKMLCGLTSADIFSIMLMEWSVCGLSNTNLSVWHTRYQLFQWMGGGVTVLEVFFCYAVNPLVLLETSIEGFTYLVIVPDWMYLFMIIMFPGVVIISSKAMLQLRGHLRLVSSTWFQVSVAWRLPNHPISTQMSICKTRWKDLFKGLKYHRPVCHFANIGWYSSSMILATYKVHA